MIGVPEISNIEKVSRFYVLDVTTGCLTDNANNSSLKCLNKSISKIKINISPAGKWNWLVYVFLYQLDAHENGINAVV